MKPTCLVVEHSDAATVVAIFEVGSYPPGSSIKIDDPLESAKAYALSLAASDPAGVYEIYTLHSMVVAKHEIHELR